MIVARNSSAGVAIGGVLYVFGGRTVRGSNSAVTEAYDPLSDRWQLMAPMPEAQGGLAAAAKGNTVFVFGGASQPSGVGTSPVLDRIIPYIR